MVIDRMENKRYEKHIKSFKWTAIINFFIAIILLPKVIQGNGSFADFAVILLPIAMYFNYKKTAKNWGGQFIEWKEDCIEFKSRKYPKTLIAYDSIQSINIHLDIIDIVTDEQTYKINIVDYTEYDDRIRLKSNFEKVNELISN